MVFDYNKSFAQNMTLTLMDGTVLRGEFLDYRVKLESIPSGKEWYQIRHSDFDSDYASSIKKGCVIVNCMGTFISDPIECLPQGTELDIKRWTLVG